MWNPFAKKPAAKTAESNKSAALQAVLDNVAAAYKRERDTARAERNAAYAKLREINAMVTPACAGVGRKMAAKAREGLPEFADDERVAA